MVVKIVRLCGDPAGKDTNTPKNREWVQLQTATLGSLLGFKLEHLTNPGRPNQAWATLYTFTETNTFRSGDLIMVYSGGGRDFTDSTSVHHRFSAGPNGAGSWRINNTGDKIRLLDPQGRVVSEVVVRAGQCDIPLKPSVPGVVVPPVRSFGSDPR